MIDISIILCSRNSELNSELKKNIKSTIGCDYELISINNSKNQYSLFEAYNLGLEKSKGKLLCFLHDDIIIHSYNWGKILKDYFNNSSDIGLIGVAGSKIKTRTPSAWWDCPEDLKVINILQHKSGNLTHRNIGFKESKLEEVAVVDGVFMVVSREIPVSFDESLGKFHAYDLNLSLELKARNLRNYVTNEILIEHLSTGKLNRDWCDAILNTHKKYNSLLPINIQAIGNKELNYIEKKNSLNFINYLLVANLKFTALKFWLRSFNLKSVNKKYLNIFRKILKS